MPIMSAPYYWLECDSCGNLADYDDFSAWKDKASAIDRAEEWTQDGEKFHCPMCPSLEPDDLKADPDFGPEAYKTHMAGCVCPDCRATRPAATAADTEE